MTLKTKLQNREIGQNYFLGPLMVPKVTLLEGFESSLCWKMVVKFWFGLEVTGFSSPGDMIDQGNQLKNDHHQSSVIILSNLTSVPMVTNQINNRSEDGRLIKVALIEHPTLWQAIVNWPRVLALCPAWGSEDEEYFYISPLAQCSDLSFQILLVCPCIRDYK